MSNLHLTGLASSNNGPKYDWSLTLNLARLGTSVTV